MVARQAHEDQAASFYSTIDEANYVGYFEPFRKGQYRQVLGRLRIEAGASHLDIGASYGWMVEIGLELGLDSHGIEPGDAPVRTAELRRRVMRLSLEDYASTTDRRFDVITIWHVLEHLPHPAAAVKLMRNLLAADGRLLVAIPNAEGYMYRLGLLMQRAFGQSRLMNELWYFHNPNFHYFYYPPRALLRLLQAGGLVPEPPFTIDAFDWTTIHQRVASALPRRLLQLAGPLVGLSGFTGRENLITIARR